MRFGRLLVWRVSGAGELDGMGRKAVWRVSLGSTRTGERRGFAGPDELFDFLQEQIGERVEEQSGWAETDDLRGIGAPGQRASKEASLEGVQDFGVSAIAVDGPQCCSGWAVIGGGVFKKAMRWLSIDQPIPITYVSPDLPHNCFGSEPSGWTSHNAPSRLNASHCPSGDQDMLGPI